MTPHDTRGDEDEGSSSRDGVNCPSEGLDMAKRQRLLGHRNGGKIDRSAEALRESHSRSSIPSRKSRRKNTAGAIRQAKTRCMAFSGI